MELSDLTAFSVQLASVMNKNDTTAYVPHTDSSSSSSFSFSAGSTLSSHISEMLLNDDQQGTSSSGGKRTRGGENMDYDARDSNGNDNDNDNDNERMNDDEDGESVPKKRRTDEAVGADDFLANGSNNDGPIAGKRPRRMPISSAYTNQFLIENGVKPADLEQSRIKSISAIGRAVVLPSGDAGADVAPESRLGGPTRITSFTPTEDIPTFLDVQHRIFLKCALDSVDTTIQFLSNEMEALDISERLNSEKPDQTIDRQSTPILDIKEVIIKIIYFIHLFILILLFILFYLF